MGLFLNLLTFVMPKYDGDMGQICIDGMNTLDKNDNGAPNNKYLNPEHHPNWTKIHP